MQKLQAVFARHFQIGNDEVDATFIEQGKSFFCTCSRKHLEAELSHLVGKDPKEINIVIDQEDPGFAHAAIIKTVRPIGTIFGPACALLQKQQSLIHLQHCNPKPDFESLAKPAA
jgi:hypothetical protein